MCAGVCIALATVPTRGGTASSKPGRGRYAWLVYTYYAVNPPCTRNGYRFQGESITYAGSIGHWGWLTGRAYASVVGGALTRNPRLRGDRLTGYDWVLIGQ